MTRVPAHRGLAPSPDRVLSVAHSRCASLPRCGSSILALGTPLQLERGGCSPPPHLGQVATAPGSVWALFPCSQGLCTVEGRRDPGNPSQALHLLEAGVGLGGA